MSLKNAVKSLANGRSANMSQNLIEQAYVQIRPNMTAREQVAMDAAMNGIMLRKKLEGILKQVGYEICSRNPQRVQRCERSCA